MTCQECRNFVTTRKAAECTRAERSAVLRHLRQCIECGTWADNLIPHFVPTEEEKRFERALNLIDSLDPEF